MCGIVGFLGFKPCYPYLFKGLEGLQNRGYDSAGICTRTPHKVYISKYASTADFSSLTLLDKEKDSHKNHTVGIGHTRWATHGAKTDANAHPHISMSGKFVLVHNGIIENYKELKNKLSEKGYTFKSSTDSEIVVNLIEYIYLFKYNGDKKYIVQTISDVTKQLCGTWGLVLLCLDDINSIYCTRQGSPLLVAACNDYAMVVSEQRGFSIEMSNYGVLRDKDICKLTMDGNEISIVSQNKYDEFTLNTEDCCLTPDPFPHWMLREIQEQSDSCQRALGYGGRLVAEDQVKLGGLMNYKTDLGKLKNLILLGCGTSLNAASMGVSYFKDLCMFNTVQSMDGAEFNDIDIPREGATGLIFLSQSGETRDLQRCIEIGRRNNLILIGVVNVVDSMIARLVDCGCYLNAGRENSVASTKSFTSQVIILALMAVFFAQCSDINYPKRVKYIYSLRRLQSDITNAINTSLSEYKTYLDMLDKPSCFVVGKGRGESIANEGSLKIKEVSYIHAEGYSGSSLKHGPFALLSPEFPVIVLAPSNCHYQKMMNAYEEIKSRHAPLLVITDQPWLNSNTIIIPSNEIFADLLCIIPLQILAYFLAIKKNINPDYPKNLAKVVTVE
jgi:glucosamine--fructose-6-phosphate aminotransferase (isomerizing)